MRTHLEVLSVAVLNDLEQRLKVAGMTGAFVMLPVVSVGEDLLFPRRQISWLVILNNGVLEDDEGVLVDPTVKDVRMRAVSNKLVEGHLQDRQHDGSGVSTDDDPFFSWMGFTFLRSGRTSHSRSVEEYTSSIDDLLGQLLDSLLCNWSESSCNAAFKQMK